MRVNWAPVVVLAGGLLLAAVGSASADHRDRDWHDRYQYTGSYRTYPVDWNSRYDRRDRDDRWDRSDRRDRERWRLEEARRRQRELDRLERERRERERAHWRYERSRHRDHDRYNDRYDRVYRD